jgi:aminomethyltransferase
MESILDGNHNLSNLGFMESTQDLTYKHENIIVTRCGYTGEDGFEVSIPNTLVSNFMDSLLSTKDEAGQALAVPVGLGARDSLRLEAGLCLYGNELREDTSPI